MLVLDSDVIIDFLNGEPTASAFVERAAASGERLATTVVNAAELHRGAEGATGSPERQADLHELLSRLTVLETDHDAARRFGAVTAALDRLGQPVAVMDALVAAVTLVNGARLVTRNKRDFDRIPGLVVVDPSADAQ